MRSLLLTFLFCTFAVFALPSRSVAAAANAQAAGATEKGEEADAEIAGWVKKLDDAKQRVEAAQQELDKLTNAKGRGAARRYPRGDAKAKYLESLKNTRAEYETARTALPEVVEDARRAGIPSGLLEPYAAAAEATAPAASGDDAASDEDAIEDEPDADAASD